MDVIIPHFLKFPLISQKRADFELFRSIVILMKNKQHLDKGKLGEIVSIKASLNKGLSDQLKKDFPSIIPVERPIVEPPQKIRP